MKKRTATKQKHQLVLRIKRLPDEAVKIPATAALPQGVELYGNKYGDIFMQRNEVVTYHIIRGLD